MFSKNSYWKSILGLFLSVVAMSFLTIFVYTNVINECQETQLKIIDETKEEEFNRIYLYYEEMAKKCDKISTQIARNIEIDIKDTFNLSKLKESLDSSGSYNPELLKIFRDNISDISIGGFSNSRNGALIVSNFNGEIVEDHNIKRASDRYSKNRNQIAKSNNFNKELYKDAIEKIENQSNEIIAIEYDAPKNKNHIILTQMNKANLKRVYKEEGLEGIKNYTFACPAYITDTGDIFGQHDIVGGVKQKNHKFIVLVEFNLYDQIMFNHKDIIDQDSLSEINAKFHTIMITLYIFGIIILVSIIIILVFIVSMYNSFVMGYEQAYKNIEEDDIEDDKTT